MEHLVTGFSCAARMVRRTAAPPGGVRPAMGRAEGFDHESNTHCLYGGN